MPRIIVFDVNETLLDVSALAPVFSDIFGDAGSLREWFSLLLLHSEVATLAGPYFDFSALARAALKMIAGTRGVSLAASHEEQVLQRMLSLPAHSDAPEALEKLLAAGLRLVTLTNSTQRAVDQQLVSAGLAKYFERSFSVDSIQRYKPAPEPYRMAAEKLQVTTGGLRMVAAHAWDIVGAMQAGCAAAFVSRPGRVLFPLTTAPDVAGADLLIVAEQILDRELRSAN